MKFSRLLQKVFISLTNQLHKPGFTLVYIEMMYFIMVFSGRYYYSILFCSHHVVKMFQISQNLIREKKTLLTERRFQRYAVINGTQY